jgi:hypothetical protein
MRHQLSESIKSTSKAINKNKNKKETGGLKSLMGESIGKN